MIIFEDKYEDLLSILFRYAYPSEIVKSFKYSNGNGNLVSMVEDKLESTTEHIYVLLDTVPGNNSIVKVYNDLKRLVSKSEGRLYVFNIVCAEYYFIKGFHSNELLLSDIGLNDVLAKSASFWSSKVIQTEEDIKFVKNFEKYCKLILIKNYKKCISHSRGNEQTNEQYGDFYTKDCICSLHDLSCRCCALQDKSYKFISEYPCRPSNDLRGVWGSDTRENLIRLHRKLVDEFNAWVDVYNEDSETCKRNKMAKHISYAM